MDYFIRFVFVAFLLIPFVVITYLYIAKRHKFQPYFFVIFYKWLAVVAAFLGYLYLAK
jgi:hypothetical protein